MLVKEILEKNDEEEDIERKMFHDFTHGKKTGKKSFKGECRDIKVRNSIKGTCGVPHFRSREHNTPGIWEGGWEAN